MCHTTFSTSHNVVCEPDTTVHNTVRSLHVIRVFPTPTSGSFHNCGFCDMVIDESEKEMAA